MNNKKIVVVDYKSGNVRSVLNAIKKVGFDSVLSSDYQEILSAKALIIPGVGSFKEGMKNLSKSDLDKAIKDFVSHGKMILGICLGMQLLFTESCEFGQTKGLDLIKGTVVQFPINQKKQNDRKIHIAWNNIVKTNDHIHSNILFENINDGTDFYFVHQYFCTPENKKYVISRSKFNEYEFCSAIRKNNIFGTQFHPEKSGKAGLEVLSNFCDFAMKNLAIFPKNLSQI